MTNYNIVVTSDIVCSWCYLGNARLAKAIARHQQTYPEDTFTVHYVPYYLAPPPQLLDPTVPAFPVESQPTQELALLKIPNKYRLKYMQEEMIELAAQDGLPLSFNGRTGVTRNGHRLVYFSQNQGGQKAQDAVMAGLWKRYFALDVDITELKVLVEVGVEAGLGSAEEIRSYLESGKDGEEVDRIAQAQRDKGTKGVPNYKIQTNWEVDGAQDPERFEAVFEKVKKSEVEGNGAAWAEKEKISAGNRC